MLVSNLDPTLFFLLDLDSVFLLVTDLDPVGAGFFLFKSAGIGERLPIRLHLNGGQNYIYCFGHLDPGSTSAFIQISVVEPFHFGPAPAPAL